jgi:hypothetical protein
MCVSLRHTYVREGIFGVLFQGIIISFAFYGGGWVHSMDELRSTQIHPIFLSRATRFVHYARRQTVFCLLLMTSFIIETHNFYFLPFLLSLMPWHTCFHVCMFSKTWFFVVKIVASTPLTVIWDSPYYKSPEQQKRLKLKKLLCR